MKALKALRALFERRSTLQMPEPWLKEALGAVETHAGVSVTAESALRATAVFACIRVLSESVAGLPLHVYRRDSNAGRERAPEHPLYRVLHAQPNTLQTSYEWRQLLMAHLLLWGNAYSEITRDGAGNVTELWPLRPDRMRLKSESGALVYEYIQPNGGMLRFPQSQILHLKSLSTDGFAGLSPIAAARQSIGLSLAAEQFGAKYFGRGARLGGVLEIAESLGPEARSRLRKSWEDAQAGLENAHRTAILEAGTKYTPFTISNEDAQFIEVRRFGVEDVCRIFRVPPHLVADLSKANYSNVDAMSREFVQHSLTPWLTNLEQRFTAALLRPEERDQYFVEHDLRGILRGDHESRMRGYQTAIYAGILSPNEARQFENLPPREGGDVFLQPVNVAPSPFNPSLKQPENVQ